VSAVIDDHVLAHYRALLDAEDAAFDELEHSYEEGRRDRFESDLVAWQHAITEKLRFLRDLGLGPDGSAI
jgi:hypothetical protein